jgi:branched-chain amino acid transport system ATP-binding protein
VCAAIAPTLVGFLADQYNLRTAFLVLVPLMGLSGVLMLFALRPYIREERRLREVVRAEALGSNGDDPGPDDGLPPADPNGNGGGDGAGEGAVIEHGQLVRAATTDGDLLVIDDLDLSYGSIQVLFGVTLRVPEVGVHALVGRNGVGKTTLLSAIAGLVDAQSGRIVYRGVDLTGVPPDQRVRLGITLMAGGRSTFPTLTVQENLWMGAYPYHHSEALVRERLDAVLEVFPQLAARLRQSGGTLSGGEQQMAALGRALMAGPRLLLVDELSLGLAPRVIEQLLPVVRSIRQLGTTVVIVEQAVSVALEVADTVMFMEKGEVTTLGDAAELGDGDELVRMMMGTT